MDLYNGRFVRYDMARRRIVIYSFIRSLARLCACLQIFAHLSLYNFSATTSPNVSLNYLFHITLDPCVFVCVHHIRSFVCFCLFVLFYLFVDVVVSFLFCFIFLPFISFIAVYNFSLYRIAQLCHHTATRKQEHSHCLLLSRFTFILYVSHIICNLIRERRGKKFTSDTQ